MEGTKLCEHCVSILAEPSIAVNVEEKDKVVVHYSYKRTEHSMLLSAYDGCHLCRRLLGVEIDDDPAAATYEVAREYYEQCHTL
jgi:hypothetical protein